MRAKFKMAAILVLGQCRYGGITDVFHVTQTWKYVQVYFITCRFYKCNWPNKNSKWLTVRVKFETAAILVFGQFS